MDLLGEKSLTLAEGATFAVGTTTLQITYQGGDGNDVVLLVGPQTILLDPGFESPSIPSLSVEYNPSGSPWTFTPFSSQNGIDSGSGVATIGPYFGPPEGTQVAILQGSASISQTATFEAGTYNINFMASGQLAQSGYDGHQTFQVLVDGQVVGTFTPPQGSVEYLSYSTSSFSVTAGSHTIAFLGLNLDGGNSAVLLDAFSLNRI